MKLIPLAVCESERFLLNVLKSLKGTFLWLRSEVELIASGEEGEVEQRTKIPSLLVSCKSVMLAPKNLSYLIS